MVGAQNIQSRKQLVNTAQYVKMPESGILRRDHAAPGTHEGWDMAIGVNPDCGLLRLLLALGVSLVRMSNTKASQSCLDTFPKP